MYPFQRLVVTPLQIVDHQQQWLVTYQDRAR
jgi:hypothetical protein